MNARDYTPIRHPSPLAHPAPSVIPSFVAARAQPDYEMADDMAEWAQKHVKAIDTQNAVDKLHEQGDLSDYAVSELSRLEAHYAQQRLMSERPAATPNGKWLGIASDACASLFEIVNTIRTREDFAMFSEVDVDKWAAICARMGYRK